MKPPSDFYILLRNKRRAEPNVYLTKEAAQNRASSLIQGLFAWDSTSNNKITIVKTRNPEKFF